MAEWPVYHTYPEILNPCGGELTHITKLPEPGELISDFCQYVVGATPESSVIVSCPHCGGYTSMYREIFNQHYAPRFPEAA